MNRMTVMRAFFGRQHYVGTGSKSVHIDMESKCTPELRKLIIEAIVLNCAPTSHVSSSGDGHHQFEYKGNPTECALIKLAILLGKKDYTDRVKRYPPQGTADWGVQQFPFSSQRKRMSWITPHPSGKGYRLYVVFECEAREITQSLENQHSKTNTRKPTLENQHSNTKTGTAKVHRV